jgi:hypothetical protein
MENKIMAQQNIKPELIPIHELVGSNTIQLDTIYQLMIEKGYFTEVEFLTKMKKVQVDYQNRLSSSN